MPYFHVVFTLPSAIGDIAYQNKAVIYNLLFKVAAETMRTIAADPAHLGARIGITAVLHTWGSAMMHHPHVHMIVSGGGISRDGSRWVSCRRRFLLPVRVLSELFRGLMLEKLLTAHAARKLQFFGSHAALTERKAFAAYLAPLRRRKWHVYCKGPFAGPEAGACLSLALYPPRRHLQQPADRVRPQRRHLQIQRLSCRRQCSFQEDDAHTARQIRR